MIDHRTNNRLCNGALWLFAGMVLLIALTSCSPYAAQIATDTPTPAPSVTATANHIPSWNAVTPTPRPSCIVTAYTLNFRSGPGTRYAVKQILEGGERVIVLSLRKDNWLQLQTAQRVTGWAYGKYIKCEIRGNDR